MTHLSSPLSLHQDPKSFVLCPATCNVICKETHQHALALHYIDPAIFPSLCSLLPISGFWVLENYHLALKKIKGAPMHEAPAIVRFGEG